MKTKSTKVLESIIREVLHENKNKTIGEQSIPTPDEMEKINKYKYETNIKTSADAKEFRSWVRINHNSEMVKLGLVSQEKFNTLDPMEQSKQKKLLKTAWETYGKEYLGDSDDVNVETDNPWVGYGVIGAILLFGAVSIYGLFKLGQLKMLNKNGTRGENWFRRRAAKALRSKLTIDHAHLTPAQVEQLVQITRNAKNLSVEARKVSFERELTKMTNMSKAEAKQVTAAIAANPAAQNEVVLTLKGIAADNFTKNQGVTEDKLKQMLSPTEWNASKNILKSKRRASTKSKTPTKSTPTAVTLKTMGKLKGSKVTTWTNFIKGTSTSDDIISAAKLAARGEDVGVNTWKLAADQVADKLAKRPGNKSKGAWLLNKHVSASTFPSYENWLSDLKAAKVKRTLNDVDYIVSKTLWNLAK